MCGVSLFNRLNKLFITLYTLTKAKFANPLVHQKLGSFIFCFVLSAVQGRFPQEVQAGKDTPSPPRVPVSRTSGPSVYCMEAVVIHF